MANIEIYTKSWCPYSVRAKALLNRKGAHYTEIDVTSDRGRELEMIERSGAHTVPQIFIDDLLIGGHDDLVALETAGQLDRLLHPDSGTELLHLSNFIVHTKDTAQTQSTELLTIAEKTFGFVPNLLGMFAESPTALKAYMTIEQIFNESSFSPTERQVVNLTASRFNECRYCMAAHSTSASMQKVPADVIEAIRSDQPIADSKLEALRTFTTTVLEKRGWISEDDTATFLAAGYSKEQVLEVILGISVKTLSNYVDHVAETPLDDAFASQAWAPIEKRAVSF